jgi:predicted DNA-binding protein
MLHFWQMGKTITIRLGTELAAWLEDAAARTGVSQGKIVREQLERARIGGTQSFLRLAGQIRGARNLSSRKGFARR